MRTEFYDLIDLVPTNVMVLDMRKPDKQRIPQLLTMELIQEVNDSGHGAQWLQKYVKDSASEIQAIEKIDAMGIPSLSPNIDDMWQQVKWSLVVTRKLKIEPTQEELDSFVRVFIEAREAAPHKWKFEVASVTFINDHLGIFLSHLEPDQVEEVMNMTTRRGAIAIILWSPACRSHLLTELYI